MCITCTGVGWRKDTILREYLKMGETDGQLGMGWYHLESNPFWNRTCRWSKDRAAFFVANKNKNRNLKIEMRVAGKAKEGKVVVNNCLVGTFKMEPKDWEKFNFVLPKEISRNELLKVEIFVDNPSKEGEDRRKMLGVAVSEAVLTG